MNLEKLFEVQKQLDERIVEEKGLQGVDLVPQKITALLVEIGELANETRCFKFWSEKPPSPRGVILEEYADALHFFISLANDFNLTASEITEEEAVVADKVHNTFNSLYSEVGQVFLYGRGIVAKVHFTEAFLTFLGLGEQLGFTPEQIEEAYLAKNEVNHMRQDTGY